jgi:hypothetical protein
MLGLTLEAHIVSIQMILGLLLQIGQTILM